MSTMVNQVRKRDGKIESFCPEKIVKAISSAMIEINDYVDYGIINNIVEYIRKRPQELLSVEEIQDMIEIQLMKTSEKNVARAYISYRDKRTVARQAKTKNVFLDIISIKHTDITKENANMNAETPAGMMMKFASESTKPFVVDYLLDKKVKEAFKNNYIHIHDLDYYPTKSLTCVQYPLVDVLKNGFKAGHGRYAGAKNIEEASHMIVVIFETNQNEMHGGQAVPAIDFFLAPYVKKTYIEECNKLIYSAEILGKPLSDELKKDLLEYEMLDYVDYPMESMTSEIGRYRCLCVSRTISRVYHAMSKMIHDLNNIHSRGGNQVVFSSINYGTDTSAEGRCVIRELLNATYDGVGKEGATAIFPIQIWKIKEGVNFNVSDRNYDLYCNACVVTAKRYFPNFINLDASFNRHPAWKEDDPNRWMYETATMGCRTRVFEDRFGETTSVGRGNLSFTSINLVRIAIEVMNIEDKEERINQFFSKLQEVADIVALQLRDRFEFQKTALKKQFPFLMQYMWKGSQNLNENDTIESVINTGTLGIGFIGLAECLVALTGHHHGESKSSQKLGLKIVNFLYEASKRYSETYQHNYSILATPAEGLSGKFTRKDRKEFGIIKGVTDRDYYTNSNHVPVYYHCTKQEKAEIEAPYHKLTLGGHIFYVEMDGDISHNDVAIQQILQMAHNNDMGYISINHNKKICQNCGYESGNQEYELCPKCGKPLFTLARITGYLGSSVQEWNSGKKAEWQDRVVHD